MLAWLSDRRFPSSAPYKLCGDLYPPSFQSNKKKKRKKGREGRRKRSFLVVPREIHKLSLIGLTRFMWPMAARIQEPPLGQFWVISSITPGAIWTSSRGTWASEVLPNLTLLVYNHCSDVFPLSPGLPPYHSCLNSAFGQIVPKQTVSLLYASDTHLALSLSYAYRNMACCILKLALQGTPW